LWRGFCAHAARMLTVWTTGTAHATAPRPPCA
jgi:hypothetical protein